MNAPLDLDEQKRAAARAALDCVSGRLRGDLVLGVGTGSTTDHFIDLLAPHRGEFAGAVASSERSAVRLRGIGVKVFDLNEVGELPVYVDGADEITADLAMTKGGGGALTREKIVASAAREFVCITDATKLVATLGRFPLPIEVIPMARRCVERALERIASELGLGAPTVRLRSDTAGEPYLTDNGHRVLDVSGWTIERPAELEARLNAVVGIVESGLFALRGADLLLLAGPRGVESRRRSESG